LKDVSLKPLYETHFKRVTESGRLRVPNTAPLPGDKGRLIQDGHRGGCRSGKNLLDNAR